VRRQHRIVGLSSYRDCDEAAGSRPDAWKTRLFRACQQLRSRPGLQSWAAARDIPFHDYLCEDTKAFEVWLQALQPDLLITCEAPVLPESVFTIPRLGTINIHYSLLPEYRGGSPLLWQVIDGSSEGGVSVHFIDAGIDTGPLIEQVMLPLPQGASATRLGQLMEARAATALQRALDKICTPGFQPREPGKGRTAFARNISQPSLVEFIDWNEWPIEKIWRVLRYIEYWPANHGIPAGWRQLCRWKVEGILRAKSRTPGGAPWSLQPVGHYLQLHCRQGSIRLSPRLHPPVLLKRTLAAIRPA
jgi:methionyl-tRNA formyltransferase